MLESLDDHLDASGVIKAGKVKAHRSGKAHVMPVCIANRISNSYFSSTNRQMHAFLWERLLLPCYYTQKL